MIIPIGHESDKVRRLPWITFGIIILCVLIFVPTNKRANQEAASIGSVLQGIILYHITHDYLELDPRVLEIIPQTKIDMIKRELDRHSRMSGLFGRGPGAGKKPDEETMQQEQETLDRLVDKLFEMQKKAFYWKYGYVPARPSLVGLIGHMFLHGGWMHLIFNLFFLYLTGPFIEDVWGRPLYAGFYIMAGIFSALTQGIFTNAPGVLGIGASGAISGAMGAFIIRFWKTKIRFAYWIWYTIGTFTAPAWVMLIFYLGRDLIYAIYGDKIMPGGSGVAHWAHVGGFAFGIAAAIIIKKRKIEETYINPKIEAETRFVDNSYLVYEEAIDLRSKGRPEDAFQKLMSVAGHSGQHPEIGEALWYGAEADQLQAAAPFFLKAIEGQIKKDNLDFALSHFRQLRDKFPQANLQPQLKILLLEQMILREELDDAEEMAREMLNELNYTSPSGLLLQFCQAVLPLSFSIAEAAASLCLQHPDILDNRKDALKASLAEKPRVERPRKKIIPPEEDVIRIPKEMQEEATSDEQLIRSPMGMKGPAPADDVIRNPKDMQQQIPVVEKPVRPPPEVQKPTPEPPRQPAPSGGKTIRVTHATPHAIKGGTLYIHVEKMGDKGLSMEHIKNIAAAKIAPADSPPFLVIDLLLDPPANDTVRVVRISSKTFNPKHLFPDAKNLTEAFRLFVSRILQMSSASPYPDVQSVLLSKINTFSTVTDYEQNILK